MVKDKRSAEEPQGGLPRNYLRACLLLLIGEQPAHGYDLHEQISQVGLANVDPGGLYRALRVMEQDGLVAVVVGALQRRPRPADLPPHRRRRRLAPRLGRGASREPPLSRASTCSATTAATGRITSDSTL